MDALFQDVSEREDNAEGIVETIIAFMKNQQYDTDGLREDLSDCALQTTSNLFNICRKNKELISRMIQFINNIKCIQITLCFLSIFVCYYLYILYKQCQKYRFQLDKYLVIGHIGKRITRNLNKAIGWDVITLIYLMDIQNQNYLLFPFIQV